MAMGAEEMILLHESLASMYWEASSEAQAAGDYDLVANNLNAALESHLMVGLLMWRRGTCPRAPVEAVWHVGVEGLRRLERISAGAEHWTFFNYLPASYCGLLLDREAELPLGPVLGRGQADFRQELLAMYLDACVLAAVATGKAPDLWESLLERIRGRRLELVRRTYELYLEMALAGRDCADIAADLVTLFDRRATDDFYGDGGETEGGGPDNRYVVDYRLATLLYARGVRQRSLPGETLRHTWIW